MAATRRRFVLRVAYEGARYIGWQRQIAGAGRSVQEVVEEHLERIGYAPPVRVVTSSRTDSGVHAVGNVLHVDLMRRHKRTAEPLGPLPPDVLRDALNFHLMRAGEAVRVIEVHYARPDFIAPRDALWRRYIYRIVAGGARVGSLPFQTDRVWQLPEPLDAEAMNRAASQLIGTHDFSSFRANGCQARSPIRAVYDAKVRSVPPDFFNRTPNPGQWLELDFRAKSFLYHQVRNMVGVLKNVGRGLLSPDDIPAILAQRDNEPYARMRAPPQGLFLCHVELPTDALIHDVLTRP